MIMKHFCQSSTVSKLFDNKDPAMVLWKGACISLLSLCWSSLQGRQGRRFRSKNLVSLSLSSCDWHSAAGHKAPSELQITQKDVILLLPTTCLWDGNHTRGYSHNHFDRHCLHLLYSAPSHQPSSLPTKHPFLLLHLPELQNLSCKWSNRWVL